MVGLLKWLNHGSVYVHVSRKYNNSVNNSFNSILSKIRLDPCSWDHLLLKNFATKNVHEKNLAKKEIFAKKKLQKKIDKKKFRKKNCQRKIFWPRWSRTINLVAKAIVCKEKWSRWLVHFIFVIWVHWELKETFFSEIECDPAQPFLFIYCMSDEKH